MVDAQAYLEHVRREGERIAQVAEGHLDEAVPSCPGNTVGSLLIHTQAFCMRLADGLAGIETDFDRLDADVLAGHRREHQRLVRELRAKDPDAPMWSWGSDQHARFWYRRAAQELAVHRWDFENAVSAPLPIDQTLAADGIDEFLQEFGPAPPEETGFKGAAQLYGGDGETIHLHATDSGGEWTITARPDRFEVERTHAKGDVAARGAASDLLLFVWGRIPPDRLDVFGDALLLERWRDRVKI